MVRSFADLYDQVWLARRGGQSHPWLVVRWIRDQKWHWDVIKFRRNADDSSRDRGNGELEPIPLELTPNTFNQRQVGGHGPPP